MGRLLLETTNFIKLYRHMVGMSEVPAQYHLWACLSLIGACVSDRVWIEKFAGAKLTPNLYVVLLGPSGVGKGVAIDLATKFVQDVQRINFYRGKATGQYLVQHLGKTIKNAAGQKVLENPKMYLCTPELSMSVGSGPVADDFIKMMTELYTGGDYLFQLGTRMYGNVTVREPCMNWLGGSTKEWFIQALTRDAIEGGALARMVLIPGRYDFNKRYTEPQLPADAGEIREHLKWRVIMLCHTEGEFSKTDAAREVEERWYQHRAVPTDEAMIPTWRRQHDLALKLAMILALADGGDLVIQRSHMIAAEQLAHAAEAAVPDVIQLASIPKEHAGYYFVRNYIRQCGRVQRSTLTVKCAKRGMLAPKLTEIVKSLAAEKAIKTEHGERGATFYVWQGRKLPELEESTTYEEVDDPE